MEAKVNMDTIYVPSEDIVARDVHGEFVIIPVTSEVVDSDESIFSLNETGKAIWDRLDGEKSLREIAQELSVSFEGPGEEIETDVVGLMAELLKRKIVVEKP